jgi:virulence-associated protein VapD
MSKSKILKRKEITFDLDVNELRAYFGDTRELKKFFSKRAFEHRQGSVYCSINVMRRVEVYELVDELKKECPWFEKCKTRVNMFSTYVKIKRL